VRLRIGNRLARQLNLNDGQRAQVDKILFQAHSEIKSLRAQSQPKFVAILDRTEKEIDAVLTPEQREKFEKVVAERKKFWGVP
ncbi:MAG: hypothetical protein JO317_07790, partial [Verrucomicrobiae bacterium]|nr:hypothetical protein [Verrucomicrobiae bacterium]